MSPKQEDYAAEMRRSAKENPGSGGWSRGMKLPRRPIPRKRAKPRRGREYDPQYRKWIKTLPCYACNVFMQEQITKTEAAHVGLRGLGQKCDDRKAIPLCVEHHQTGKLSAHRSWHQFWEALGCEPSAPISIYQAKYIENPVSF